MDMDAIYEMLQEVVNGGEIPYMLISPEHVVDELRTEFPHLVVCARGDIDIICITADPDHFVNGSLVLH